MWLKILGSMLIVAAGGWTGFAVANRYCERTRQIGQLIGCLTALRSYVNYASMPLPEALSHCGSQVDGPVRELFHHTARTLTACGWLTPRQALAGALETAAGRLELGEPEREALLQLGANLGSTNRGEQQKYLTMVLAQLEQLEQESRRARDQNVKMYRYLGICGGLAVVILLV
ncbi:MAG: stage III sporulation protein AB [Negativicutes bacterium]|nr:stage III sporulation protein AB [Negativicutes bacterium]